MQSNHTRKLDHNDPGLSLLKNTFLEDAATLEWTEITLHAKLTAVYGAILKFCWYESYGTIASTYDIDMPLVKVPQACYEAGSDQLTWIAADTDDRAEIAAFADCLNERALVLPMQTAAQDYDKKMQALAILFQRAYHAYASSVAQLQRLEPAIRRVALPAISASSLNSINDNLKQLSQYNSKHGTPLRSEPWIQMHNDRAAWEEMKFLQHYMSEFIVDHYFPGSQLFELHTAACFIQETIQYVAHDHLKLNLMTDPTINYPQRWRKHVAVRYILEDEEGSVNTKCFVFDADTSHAQEKIQHMLLLDKIVKLEFFQSLLSPAALSRQPDPARYYKNLFAEAEHFYQAISTERTLRHLDSNTFPACLASDFALGFIDHDAVIAAIVDTQDDAKKHHQTLLDICYEAAALIAIDMPVCDLLGPIVDINPRIKKMFAASLSAGKLTGKPTFFKLDHLKNEYSLLSNAIDRHMFMANLLICASLFIEKIIDKDCKMTDQVNYTMLRRQIVTALAATSSQPGCPSLDGTLDPAEHLKILQNDFVNPFKSPIDDKHADHDLEGQNIDKAGLIYSALIIMKFCQSESKGMMTRHTGTEIPNISSPQFAYNDRASTMIWEIQSYSDLRIQRNSQRCFNVDTITAMLKSIDNDYEKKSYYLFMLYTAAHQIFFTNYTPIPDQALLTENNLLQAYKNLRATIASYLTTGMDAVNPDYKPESNPDFTRAQNVLTGALLTHNKKTDRARVRDETRQAVHKKYFKPITVTGNEYLIAACFVQSAIAVLVDNFTLLGVDQEYVPLVKSRWKRLLLVVPEIVIHSKDNSRTIATRYDRKNLAHLSREKLLQACVSFDNLHHSLFSRENLRYLYEELEEYINDEMQNFPYKNLSPILDNLYTSDFAKNYFSHLSLEKISLKTPVIKRNIFMFIDTACNALMQYCDTLVNDHLIPVTGIYYNNISLDELIPTVSTIFDLEKIFREFSVLPKSNTIEFAANIYVEVYLIRKIVQTWLRKTELVKDPVYKIDRARIKAKIYALKVVVNTKDKPVASRPNKAADKAKETSPSHTPAALNATVGPFLQQYKLIAARLDAMAARKITLTKQVERLSLQIDTAIVHSNNQQRDALEAQRKQADGLNDQMQGERYDLHHNMRLDFEDMKPDDVARVSANEKQLEALCAMLALQDGSFDAMQADIDKVLAAIETIFPKAAQKKIQADQLAAQHDKQLQTERFNNDVFASQGQIKGLETSLALTKTQFTDLQNQLKDILELDNDARQFDLRAHKKIVLELEYRLEELAPESRDLQKQLDNINASSDQHDAVKNRLTRATARQVKLLADIQKEAFALEHIIPKKTSSKKEEAFLLAQQKKQQSQQAEEKPNPKREKIARPRPTPKLIVQPPTRSVALVKPEPKTVKKPDPFKHQRLAHLNEACKNLILIQKIQLLGKDDTKAAVTHFALLYNIFRCFQSLSMYLQAGGQQRDMNADEIKDLRNMIIHHGAGKVHEQTVAAFARDIQKSLPQQLLNLSSHSPTGFKLDQDQRGILINAFGLVESGMFRSQLLDHTRLVLDNTDLYRKLLEFHAQKITAEDDAICQSVLSIYIPQIKEIMTGLGKVTSPDSDTTADNFIEMFYFELQALRMLATICGEFAGHFKHLKKADPLQVFLNFCRTTVRNAVGHDKIDFVNPDVFFEYLRRAVNKLDENKILAPSKPKAHAIRLFNNNTQTVREDKMSLPVAASTSTASRSVKRI